MLDMAEKQGKIKKDQASWRQPAEHGIAFAMQCASRLQFTG